MQRGLCVSDCLSVCLWHKSEPCKNGWTDPDAVRVVAPQAPCVRSFSVDQSHCSAHFVPSAYIQAVSRRGSRRLRPRSGAHPGESVWVCITGSDPRCHLASHFEHTPFSRGPCLAVIMGKHDVIHTELSVGPFCVTQPNPTHQLTDPTQPNPQQVEKFGPNPTRPNPTQYN